VEDLETIVIAPPIMLSNTILGYTR